MVQSAQLKMALHGIPSINNGFMPLGFIHLGAFKTI